MRRTKTRLAATAAALLATLALTGCVKLDEDLTINADNTVDGTVTVAFNKAMLDMVGATAEDALSETGGVPEGDNVTVEPYDDGTFVGQTYTLDGAPLTELNSGGGEGDLQITRDGDNFHVTGTLDFSDSQLGGGGGVPTDGFEVRIALTFPGEIVSSTGAIDGNTVTWTPELGDVVDFETVARAEGGGGAGSGLLPLAGLSLAAVAAAGVGVVVVHRRKTAPAVVPSAAAAGMPTVDPGTPPFPTAEPFPAGATGSVDPAASGPWATPTADGWAAPTGDPRADLDAAPPAAVPFDPTQN